MLSFNHTLKPVLHFSQKPDRGHWFWLDPGCAFLLAVFRAQHVHASVVKVAGWHFWCGFECFSYLLIFPRVLDVIGYWMKNCWADFHRNPRTVSLSMCAQWEERERQRENEYLVGKGDCSVQVWDSAANLMRLQDHPPSITLCLLQLAKLKTFIASLKDTEDVNFQTASTTMKRTVEEKVRSVVAEILWTPFFDACLQCDLPLVFSPVGQVQKARLPFSIEKKFSSLCPHISWLHLPHFSQSLLKLCFSRLYSLSLAHPCLQWPFPYPSLWHT